MTVGGVEPELIFVTRAPSEFYIFVTVVDHTVGCSLSFANNAVTDDQFVFQVFGKTFESDVFVETFSNEPNFVLLEDIVHRREGEKELFHLGIPGLKPDVKGIILFL